jgi:uroporphyrinogen-III synthase
VRVIVTRPAAQAAEWVADLQAQGLDAVALPLIEIRSVPDPAALVAAWTTLARQRLVAFVSPNAAQCFFAQRPAGAAWPSGTLAASPGPGTTRVLLSLGVPAAQIIAPAADAAQFDSESLWAELGSKAWQGADVLVVRGDGGRDWLAERLRTAGARVSHLSAYRRAAPQLEADGRALLAAALAAPAAHLWLFSSSQAIEHLAALAPPHTAWGEARAVGTHPRIVARARQLGIDRTIAARPALADVIACIQSLRP